MTERSGPFWDAVLGRAPIPRAAATLGAEFVGFDAENATIDLAFTATEDFTNPAGNVLGAFWPRCSTTRWARPCWPHSSPANSRPPWSSRPVSSGRPGRAGSTAGDALCTATGTWRSSRPNWLIPTEWS